MSPDGKHMVSVGDTKEVFLFSVNKDDFQRIQVLSGFKLFFIIIIINK